MKDHLQNAYIASAGAILGLAGFAKLLAAGGEVKILAEVDPILGVHFRVLILAAALAELAIGSVCLFSKSKLLSISLVAWLSTNILTYRVGLWSTGWEKPCYCLGNITDALNISPQTADTIMKFVLAYLLIGGYGLLIWHWRRVRGTGGAI